MDSSSSSSSSSIRFPIFINPKNPQSVFSNGPPKINISDAEWNEDLGNLIRDFDFCIFMMLGQCEKPFHEWYKCMARARNFDGNRDNCLRFSGVLRDCVFANPDYHDPLFRYISRRSDH